MKLALILWAAAMLLGVYLATRESKDVTLSPEQLIEQQPSGAGIVEQRPGYFRKERP